MSPNTKAAVLTVTILSFIWAGPVCAEPVTLLHTFASPLGGEHFGESRIGRAGKSLWLINGNTIERWLVDERTQKRDGVWILPFEIKSRHALHVAPVDRDRCWLVEAGERKAWLIHSGKWRKPLQLSDPLAGAVAHSSGGLIVSTPEHSSHSLALITPDGQVRLRFGGRQPSPISQQASLMNTWRLATLAGGELVAAHAYLPLLRLYEPDGRLKWEHTIETAAVEPLEQQRRVIESAIDVRVEGCCITSKAIHFATSVATHENRIAIRFGMTPRLEIFGDDGQWRESITLNVPPERQYPWVTAGLVYSPSAVAAVELDRIVIYRRASDASIRGTVIGHDELPLVGARVTLIIGSGGRVELLSDQNGMFDVRGLSAEEEGQLEISADGHLPLTSSGVFAELVRDPLRLSPLPRQCVVVRSAQTDDVVTQYTLQIGRSFANQTDVMRSGGISVSVKDEAGRGCLQLPFSPPFLVRVTAKDHATREVEVADTSEKVIELEDEVPLRVITSTNEDIPVSKVRVVVLPGDAERRGNFAVSNELVQQTDEEGVAKFQGLAAGKYLLLVEHPDFLRIEKLFEISSSVDEIDLRLERGTSLVVQMVDATTRQPLADGRFYADPRGVRISHALTCMTEADGTCILTGMPQGRYSLRTERAGYVRAHETVVIGATPPSHAVVSLSRAVDVTGRVLGTEGYPDLVMEVAAMKAGVPAVYAPVGADGEFRMSEAPAGSVSFWVRDADAGVDSTLLHRLVDIPESASTFRVDLQLPAATVLSGRIVDSAGAGCGDCTAEFQRISGDYTPTLHRARVGGDGRYEVRLSSSGPYLARIAAPSSKSSLVEEISVSGRSRRDFQLAARELEVRVKGSNGEGVARALVTLQSGTQPVDEIIADSYGTARFHHVGPTTVRIIASSDGRTASREVALDRNATSVELVLTEERSLRMRIVDSISGLSVYAVDARVTGARGETILRTNVIRDDDGIIVLPAFAAPMTVVLKTYGYAARTMHGVVGGDAIMTVPLVPQPRAFTIEVDLQKLTPCALEVRDANGQLAALSPLAGATRQPFTLGSSMFYGLDRGSYTVILFDCDGRAYPKPLVLREGGSSHLTFP